MTILTYEYDDTYKGVPTYYDDAYLQGCAYLTMTILTYYGVPVAEKRVVTTTYYWLLTTYLL